MLQHLSPAPVWSYVYRDVFKENDFNITVFGTFAWLFAWFWGWSLLMMIPDLTGRPAWMLQYKVQPGTNAPVDKDRLWRAVKGVLFNDVVVGLTYLVLLYPVQLYMGCSCRPDQLPSLLKFITDFIIITVMDEAGFYYTHRLLHWPPLYKRYHKRHHEWTSPVGVVASYSHPLEHIVSNLIPLLLSPALVSAHLSTVWIWIVVTQTITVFHHSGYNIPYMPCPLYHDYHHLRFNGNYGSGFLDRLHGTDLGIPGDLSREKRK